MKKLIFVLMFTCIVLPASYSQSEDKSEKLMNNVLNESRKIKNTIKSGVIEYEIIRNEGLVDQKKEHYSLQFSGKKYLTKYSKNAYVMYDEEKYYSVELDAKNRFRLINFSRIPGVNEFFNSGYFIDSDFICDKISIFNRLPDIEIEKWGKCVKMERYWDFKGDKIHNIIYLSKEGILVNLIRASQVPAFL